MTHRKTIADAGPCPRPLPWAARTLRALIQLYRHTLSPAQVFLFGAEAGCRFTPTCSQYAVEAIETHGAMTGSLLAVKRICRCHPLGDCGHDPVPPAGRLPGAEPTLNAH